MAKSLHKAPLSSLAGCVFGLLLTIGILRGRLWTREIRFFTIAVTILLVYALGRYIEFAKASFPRGLTLEDIRAAVSRANSSTPVGTLNGPKQDVALQASGQMDKAADYSRVVVAWRNCFTVSSLLWRNLAFL